MKRTHRIVIALMLAVVMGFMVPLQVSASVVKKEYISDIKIVKGVSQLKDATQSEHTADAKKNAKKILADAGYKMVDSPIYSANNTYLGYKTTNDPTEAITDISAMNMRGGYTMADYSSIKAKLRTECAAELSSLMLGINEFRANKNAGSPAAEYAYKMLNRYKEDDSGKLMGDFFMDEDLTDDAVLNILMETNGGVSGMLKEYISVGCTPYGQNADGSEKTNWMQRLSKNGPDSSLSDDYFEHASVLEEKLSPVKTKLEKYVEYANKYGWDVTQETLSSQLDESELYVYSDCKALYTILKSYSYGGKTLADLILSNYDVYDLYPMAKVLTDVEYGMIYVADIQTTIKCASSDSAVWNAASDSSDAMVKSEGVDTISVYTGVNRDLIKGNVALTSAAVRDTNIYGDDYNWFTDSGAAQYVKYAMIGIASVAVASFLWCAGSKLAGGAGFGGYVTTYFPGGSLEEAATQVGKVATKFQTVDASAEVPIGIWMDTHSYIWSAVGNVFRIALAVLAVVAVVYGILYLVAQYSPEKTPIPGIMYDTVITKANVISLVRYDALTNLDGVSTDTQYGLSGNQWVELYYTKDKAAGDPITTDVFIKNTNSAAAAYTPVHMFGEKSAFSVTGNDTVSYMFFLHDANAYTYGSVFSDSSFIVTACAGLLVGIVVGAFGGIAISKKKKKNQEAA